MRGEERGGGGGGGGGGGYEGMRGGRGCQYSYIVSP